MSLGHGSILLVISYRDIEEFGASILSIGKEICQDISYILFLNFFPTDVGIACIAQFRQVWLKQEAFVSELIISSLEQERMCL